MIVHLYVFHTYVNCSLIPRQCIQAAEVAIVVTYPDCRHCIAHILPYWSGVHTDRDRTSGLLQSGIQIVGCMHLSWIVIFKNWTHYKVKELELNYTTCVRNDESGSTSDKPVLCSDVIAADPKASCECHLNFTIDEDIRRDVYLYYGLTNFYQNHRRYVKSRDDRQLLGESKGSGECKPFDKRDDKFIAPCGAIANSLFNDTFLLFRYADRSDNRPAQSVPFIKTGIAWATDKNAKFRNPIVPEGQNLSYAFKDTVPPPNWPKPVYELEPKDDNNNGSVNEDLIVWMRTAALPTFRKLWGRVRHDTDDNNANYRTSLPKGRYLLKIKYSKTYL